MSTFNSTLIIDNTTDALFRAWCQWIHDRLAAFGWVQTADTGQINLTTVAAPTGGNANKGYEIWRMADSLQATAPVFMKLSYGSLSGANDPCLFVQLGTGSNGSGTLTGQTNTQIQFGTQTPSGSVAYNCWASGGTNRFCMTMPSDVAVASQLKAWSFGVERTKDSAGADSAEGIFFYQISGQQGVNQMNHQTIPFTGSIPTPETQWLCALFPSAGSTGVVGADLYTFPVYPILYYPRNPVMNIVTYFAADVTRETPIVVDMYGASHTYLPCGMPTANGIRITARDVANTAQVARLAMRYE